jgi:predicted CoA-binding protein
MTPEMTSMLAAKVYAVVGASRDPEKYGFLVYRSLKSVGKTAFPVNSRATEVDGDVCYPTLAALPQMPEVAVMMVPSAVTEAAVAECARLGIQQIWMQPGAESAAAIALCREKDIAVVAGGPCLMVLLRTAQYQLP